MNQVITIVLPVFNEEQNLFLISEKLRQILTSLNEKYILDFEVIFINDGSVDGSGEIMQSLYEQDRRFKVITFSRNFGHQTAVSAGLYFSKGHCVLVMDADLQDPPEIIGSFVEKWKSGFDVVYAIRTKRKENIFKKFSYFLFYRILKKISTIDIPLDSGDFCLMDKKVVAAINALPERSRFVRGLRSWVGFKQIGVEYERAERYAGESKYSFSKLLKLAFDGIISFSSSPLKLASFSGFCFCVLSVFLVCFLVFWKILKFRLFGMYPGQVVGWTSLVAIFLLVSGFQLLILGVLGEYIGRMFDEVKHRSPWVISKMDGFELSKKMQADILKFPLD